MQRIDSHHHFWRYDPDEYPWISDSMGVLKRDFLPPDLSREISEAGIAGVISVQARQTLAETRWLLDLADQNSFIRAVVGWAPLVDPEVGHELERMANRPKLRAVRHVLQDEPDDNYMLRPDFDRGIARLKQFGLVYDILIYERHLPQTLQFVDRHPNQTFVLDHVAKPRIARQKFSPWQANLSELARRPNVYCKLSGMVTEADHHQWTAQQLRPYMEIALQAFGPKRLMFGSDWPVCLLACGYGKWYQIVQDFIAALSPAEQDQVLGGTAMRAYGIKDD